MIRRRHVRYVQQRRWCDRIAFHHLGVGVAAYTKSDSRHTTWASSGTLSRRVLSRNVSRLVNSGGFRIFRWNWRRPSGYGRSNRPVDKMAWIAQTTSPPLLLRRAITRREESGRRFLGFLPPALFRYLDRFVSCSDLVSVLLWFLIRSVEGWEYPYCSFFRGDETCLSSWDFYP